jgi:hypothetical protein
MNFQQKSSHRREMLGCAKIARGYAKGYKADGEDAAEEARKWNEVAAKHLFKLNGMMGNW